MCSQKLFSVFEMKSLELYQKKELKKKKIIKFKT